MTDIDMEEQEEQSAHLFREWAALREEFDAYKASQAREIRTKCVVVEGPNGVIKVGGTRGLG